jgi:hypothetical protein
MRQSLILAGVLFLATPALAEDASPAGVANAGRYAIQSGDDGFVRLDTETGAVSHCKRSGGTWHCDALAEDRAGLEKQVATLSAEVKTLGAEISRLKNEIATLKAAAPKTETSLTPEEEREFDKAMSFAERLMKRFFEMVRDLKGEEKPAI